MPVPVRGCVPGVLTVPRYKPGLPQYPDCDMTVTVYHVNFNPFGCRRTVLKGVYFGHRKKQSTDKTGTQHGGDMLLIIPQTTAARVSPALYTGVQGAYILEPGDKVLPGEGPEITTREQWAELVPATAPVTTLNWVEPFFLHGEPCHVEAGT